MKIASVVGARPQFVKLAPVDLELRSRGFSHQIVNTGQHYDYEMSASFYEQLDIPAPDVDLGVGSGTHGAQTGKMLDALEALFAEERPDLVLVYGDTNSTLAGALAAVKIHVPVAHVESGYRSNDMSMPEEVNRILVDRMSQLLLAPTRDAVANLISEGVDENKIVLVGNIMAQTLLDHRDKVELERVLSTFGLKSGEFFLMTIHRPENTDDPERLKSIFYGLKGVDVPVLLPAHPRTQALIDRYSLSSLLEEVGIRVIPPQSYLDFLALQTAASVMLTDSGGIQEESLMVGTPCVTMRYNTERTLTVEMGANRLVGAESKRIREGIAEARTAPIVDKLPEFWDGRVAERIVDAIDRAKNSLDLSPPTRLDT